MIALKQGRENKMDAANSKSNIPDNGDTSEEYSEDEEIKLNKKQEWNVECILDTTDEMDAYFEENRFWKKSTLSSTKSGSKTYYYCNINGRVLPKKCPAQLCVLKKENKTNFIVQRANDHNHVADKPSKKMNLDVLNKIKEYHEQGLRQGMISHKLRDDDNILSAPTKHQVCYLIDHFLHFGSQCIWCSEKPC